MNDHVVIKLCTGETILAVLINETQHGIVIIDAISIKCIPGIYEGDLIEQTVVSIFCPFSADLQFTFNNKDILFCKPLRDDMIKYYKNSLASLKEEKKKPESDEKDLENTLNLLSKTFKLH